MLTERQKQAAVLVATDHQSDTAIARAVGVTRQTVVGWKKKPAFVEAVAAESARILEAVRKEGITNKQNRLDALNADFTKLEQVIAERAVDPLVANVPGGQTGLIVPEPMLVKVWDVGEHDAGDPRGEAGALGPKPVGSRIVYVYRLDDAVLNRRQQLAKQAAIEIGDWEEKRKVAAFGAIETHVSHEHSLDFDSFARVFAEVAGLGGRDSVLLEQSPIDGHAEPLDSTGANGASGGVPSDPNP